MGYMFSPSSVDRERDCVCQARPGPLAPFQRHTFFAFLVLDVMFRRCGKSIVNENVSRSLGALNSHFDRHLTVPVPRIAFRFRTGRLTGHDRHCPLYFTSRRLRYGDVRFLLQMGGPMDRNEPFLGHNAASVRQQPHRTCSMQSYPTRRGATIGHGQVVLELSSGSQAVYTVAPDQLEGHTAREQGKRGLGMEETRRAVRQPQALGSDHRV